MVCELHINKVIKKEKDIGVSQKCDRLYGGKS